MYENKTIVAVVPACNEEDQIGKVIETMPEFVDRIVVIDDSSTDNTNSIVRKYQETNDRIELITHQENSGVGGAIASGYKWARDNAFDIAVVMAGDGQMDPGDLPHIVTPVAKDEVDYSKGNRLFTGEAYKKIPKVRYFGNGALSLLTKIASGYWHIADSQSGYTAINKNALHCIDWDKMYKGYGQPNDLLVRLNTCNMKVKDVPIRPVYDVGERSDLKIKKVIFTIGWLLVKLFIWRLKEKYIIRDFHPLVFFYLLGFMMFFFNVVFFIRLIYLWIDFGYVPEITLLIWIFTFSIGLMSTFFAMWFDMEYNKLLRGQ